MIQAILFDCDGLMFDTERIAISIWKEEAEKARFTLPEGFFERITGSGGPQVEAYMQSIQGLTPIRKKAYARRFDLDFWKSFPVDALNKPGLLTLYAYLKQKGYALAVCSSSHKTYVETLLSRVSIPLQFDAIITGDMVVNPKPAPDIFLKGAQTLKVSSENCLVLEDSKQGILAAKKAGMHSCWIKDRIEADEEMRQNIEYTAENLNGVISLLEEGI